MCDLDFDEYATVWDERLVSRARKAHRCATCWTVIAAGASYIAHFSVTCGDPTHEKQCLRCRVIADAFTREHGSSVSPGSLYEFLDQCLDEERWLDDDDDDDDEGEDEDGAAAPRDRRPSRLSDEELRWKYAMVEIRARGSAAREVRE